VGSLERLRSGEYGERDRQFDQIVGSSAALESLLSEVERVSPTNSTVLVLGETGSGKELIAHAIHNLSPRHERPFVKVNCAAIPFDLLESELFGHEKGAFTGAVAQKIGRFEMADTGTLFLDEIGDLPLALQPKLLRVLQEQEFERLGSGRTHRINVRLVAATHRDLVKMVARNEFRSDLYYRLNVFPVMVPPLRERREDIRHLVLHFVEVFARRMEKRIEQIPETTMNALIAYPWPGNVRELQNLIERAVIRSDDGVLPNPLPSRTNTILSIAPQGTLRDHEAALIMHTLKATGGTIGGRRGAAVGKMSLPDVLFYLVAQFSGALGGGCFARYFFAARGWPSHSDGCGNHIRRGRQRGSFRERTADLFCSDVNNSRCVQSRSTFALHTILGWFSVHDFHYRGSAAVRDEHESRQKFCASISCELLACTLALFHCANSGDAGRCRGVSAGLPWNPSLLRKTAPCEQ
jgi:formate hydrogenlyase transcriptional activator